MFKFYVAILNSKRKFKVFKLFINCYNYLIIMKAVGFFIVLLSLAFCKIVMIQELFRHGARYPIYSTLDNYSIYAKNERL